MKSKKTKRFVSMVLAVFMTLAMLTQGMAQTKPDNYTESTATNGKITLNAPNDEVDLTGMKVSAYRMLKQIEYGGKIALIPTDEFDGFFGISGTTDALKTAYKAKKAQYDADKSAYDQAVEQNPSQDTVPDPGNLEVYVVYNSATKALELKFAEPESGDFIGPIVNPIFDDQFFTASLIQEILGEKKNDNSGLATNAANAMLLSEWARSYIANKPVSTSGNDYKTQTATHEEEDADNVVFDGLLHGYWVLISSNVPAGVANVRTIMKLTDKEAEEGVTATIKLEDQSFTKKVKRNGEDDTKYNKDAVANIGDLLDYKLSFVLQNLNDYVKTVEGGYTFKLGDTMKNQQLINKTTNKPAYDGATVPNTETAYVGFVQNAFKVTFTWYDDPDAKTGAHTVTYVDKDPSTPDKALSTLLKNTSKYGTYTAANGQNFVLDFDVAKLREIADADGHLMLGHEAQVTVEYTAELTKEAVRQNGNTAEWDYSNDPSSNQTVSPDDPHTDVYTYGLDVTKKFSDNNNTTNNFSKVTFNLYKASYQDVPVEGGAPEATERKLVVGDLIKFATETGSYYYTVDANGSADIKPNTTGGNFKIYGLEPGYYVLRETAAPDAYYMAGDILVYIDEDGTNYFYLATDSNASEGGIDLGATRTNEEGITGRSYVVFDVLNQKKFPLPGAGSAGTWALSIGGTLLAAMGLYIVSMIRRRKVNAQTEQ